MGEAYAMSTAVGNVADAAKWAEMAAEWLAMQSWRGGVATVVT